MTSNLSRTENGIGRAKPGTFDGNKTFGRVITTQSNFIDITPAQEEREKLAQLERRYREHLSGEFPLGPWDSLQMRGEIDDLSTRVRPGVANAWAPPGQYEVEYVKRMATEARRFGSKIGILAGGPVMSGLAAPAFLLKAPDETIAELAGIGSGSVLARILKGNGRIYGKQGALTTLGGSGVPAIADRSLPVLRPSIGLYAEKPSFKRIKATYSNEQLDAKFKHAEKFDIQTSKKNPQTLNEFKGALQAHLDDPFTSKNGTYLFVKNSEVFYNPMNNRVVVLSAEGRFITAFRIFPDTRQYNNYLKTGGLK